MQIPGGNKKRNPPKSNNLIDYKGKKTNLNISEVLSHKSWWYWLGGRSLLSQPVSVANLADKAFWDLGPGEG